MGIPSGTMWQLYFVCQILCWYRVGHKLKEIQTVSLVSLDYKMQEMKTFHYDSNIA